MANRPNTLPSFCTDNPSNREPLPADLVRTGFLPDLAVPVEYINQELGLLGEWVSYFDGAQNATQVLSATEPNVRLLEGGRWSYTSTTNTLAWSAAAYLAYPGLPDTQNTIAAGSAVVPAGSVAYVVSNAPFVDNGATTSASTTVSGLTYVDQVQVGWAVSGSGIPAGANVSAIDTKAKTLTLSAAATATAASVRLVFTGSGPLTVQVADIQSFVATSNTVVLARATPTGCIVGVGSGQMRLHELESKPLLGTGYQDIQRLVAGEAITAGQLVYMCLSAGDGNRTVGQVYVASAAATYPVRAMVYGVALSTVAAGASTYVVTEGQVPGFTGLNAGYSYYLSPTTAGTITIGKPATDGQSVALVGIAINSSMLLLASPASRVPYVSTTVYAPQQVYMGTFHRAAQAAGSPTSQDFTPFLVQAADGKTAYRQWTTGAAGNVLKVKINSVTGLPSNVSIRVFRGNYPGTINDSGGFVMYQGGGTPFDSLPGGGGTSIKGYWYNIPIGSGAFNAYDTLGLALSFSSTAMEINAQADMVVSTAS